MLQIKDKISINADQARYILEKETSRFGVCIDLDRALAYQADLIEAYKPIAKPFRELGGNNSLTPNDRNELIQILQRRFRIPHYKMTSDNKLSISKDIVKSLIEDPSVDEVARAFLKLYQQLKVCSYNISYLNQYIDLPLLKEESIDGNRMVLARPTWKVLTTKRISARTPSLQNVSAHFADIITTPKGFVPVFADSGQIEPRVTYSYFIDDPLIAHLITIYNDAYYGLVHYALLSDEEDAKARENIPAVGKKELSAELRSELKLILLVGNYGGDLEGRGFNPDLVVGFRNRVQNHPKRKLWESEVTDNVRSGQDTFYTAFGTAITPEETTKYKKTNTPKWISHLIRCGINNPIQGTASDLMCESVYAADRIIREKAKGQTNIGYYKHDEGFFNVDEKDAHLIDELTDCLSYQVDGWIPIYSDPHIGKKTAKPIKGMEDLVADEEMSELFY